MEREKEMDGSWSRLRDSNPGPTVYKTVALPTELSRREKSKAHYQLLVIFSIIDKCKGLAFLERLKGNAQSFNSWQFFAFEERHYCCVSGNHTIKFMAKFHGADGGVSVFSTSYG